MNRFKKLMTDFERDLFKKFLEKFQWHQGRLAKYFGLHRKSIEYKLKSLALKRPKKFRPQRGRKKTA